MTIKEQSSTSPNPNHKIITPNKELVGVKKSEPKKEVTKDSTKLPQPNGLENSCFTIQNGWENKKEDF